MFFEHFVALCQKKGVSPSRATVEAGINKSAVTYWKKNPTAKPTGQIAVKLCNYFDITMAELYGEELEQKEKALVNNDEELTEYLEMLKNRSECRMLFKLAKTATKEDVEQTVKIIEAIRNK